MGKLVDNFMDAMPRVQIKTRQADQYCKLCRYALPNGCRTKTPMQCPAVQAEYNELEAQMWVMRRIATFNWIKEDL